MQRKKIDLDDGRLDLANQNDLKTNEPFSLVQTKEEDRYDLDQGVTLEPMRSDSYDLSYTCLLIPRFPSHQLKGDLVDFLSQWLQQICLSYGWRLEFTTINPDYFQWGFHVNVSVTPARFIHTIRSETSKFILSNFGRIAKDNLSNDFWAPGHLVVLGIRPHPDEMIVQYIRLTRRQQGLYTL
jgi:REP element-mobilizing transposase RayT